MGVYCHDGSVITCLTSSTLLSFSSSSCMTDQRSRRSMILAESWLSFMTRNRSTEFAISWIRPLFVAHSEQAWVESPLNLRFWRRPCKVDIRMCLNMLEVCRYSRWRLLLTCYLLPWWSLCAWTLEAFFRSCTLSLIYADGRLGRCLEARCCRMKVVNDIVHVVTPSILTSKRLCVEGFLNLLCGIFGVKNLSPGLCAFCNPHCRKFALLVGKLQAWWDTQVFLQTVCLSCRRNPVGPSLLDTFLWHPGAGYVGSLGKHIGEFTLRFSLWDPSYLGYAWSRQEDVLMSERRLAGVDNPVI